LTVIEILYGIVFQPVPTFRYLGSSKPLFLALTAFSVSALSNMIINLGINQNTGIAASLPEAYIGIYLLLGLIISLAVLAAAAAVYNLLGEIMFQQANGRGMLCCLALAFVPGILAPPLQYAFSILNWGFWNAGISLLAFVWVIVLQIIGIREALVIQGGQALLLFLLPGVILALLILFTLVLLVFLLPGMI
jgi:hypothetical protein